MPNTMAASRIVVISTNPNVQVNLSFNMMDEYVTSMNVAIAVGSEGYQEQHTYDYPGGMYGPDAIKQIGIDLQMNVDSAVYSIKKRHKDVEKAVSSIMAN